MYLAWKYHYQLSKGRKRRHFWLNIWFTLFSHDFKFVVIWGVFRQISIPKIQFTIFFFFFSSQVSASTLKLCLNCPCRGKWKLLIVSIHFTNGCTLVLYKQLIQTGSVLMLLPLFSLLNFPLYKDTANVRADTHHTCPIGYSDKIVDWSRNFSRASQ